MMMTSFSQFSDDDVSDDDLNFRVPSARTEFA